MGGVINTFLMPILQLSGILLPVQLGPDWLQKVAFVVPFRHIVDGTRACFAGDLTSSSVMWGGGWAVVLAALGIWWGTSAFRRDD